jgi:hypothetical protein
VHPDQHQPEMPGQAHSDDEIAALMTRLAIVEACHTPTTALSRPFTRLRWHGELLFSHLPCTLLILLWISFELSTPLRMPSQQLDMLVRSRDGGTSMLPISRHAFMRQTWASAGDKMGADLPISSDFSVHA